MANERKAYASSFSDSLQYDDKRLGELIQMAFHQPDERELDKRLIESIIQKVGEERTRKK